MRAVCVSLSVAMVLGLVGLWSAVRADEEKVPLKSVPKAVVESVKKAYPEAKIKGAEKENEDGKTEYEIAIDNKGQKIEVTLTPEGTITELEKQVEAGTLPKTASEAVEGKYPKANVKSIEEVYQVKDGKETLEDYEIQLVTADGKKLEVSVTPEGKFTNEEDKCKDKD